MDSSDSRSVRVNVLLLEQSRCCQRPKIFLELLRRVYREIDDDEIAIRRDVDTLRVQTALEEIAVFPNSVPLATCPTHASVAEALHELLG